MTDKTELQIPKAIETEQALLGAILLDPSILDQLGIGGDVFFSEAHKVIYTNMRALGPNRLDHLTLTELLQSKDKLDEAGGALYLLELVRNCPYMGNWETYERIIKDKYQRRQVITQAENLARAAINEGENINQAIAEITTNLVTTAQPLHGTVHISEIAKRLYETIEARADDPKEIYGLETGIIDFDKITHGLQKRETLILAGTPGSGKSMLAFQIAYGMAESGHPGAIYELEMSSEAVLRRKISAISGLLVDQMRSGVGMDQAWTELTKAIDESAKQPIYITDATGYDPIAIRADLARQKAANNIEWFLIDYMDLVKADGLDHNEKSAFISQQLHGIAKDLDLAGLIIHSMNKTGYQAASMQALSGSAKVGYDADQIVLLESDTDNKNLITLSWVKMREGDSRRKMRMIRAAGLPEFKCVAFDEVPTLPDYFID